MPVGAIANSLWMRSGNCFEGANAFLSDFAARKVSIHSSLTSVSFTHHNGTNIHTPVTEDYEYCTSQQHYTSHSQMLGKFEYGGGPTFKVVLEC